MLEQIRAHLRTGTRVLIEAPPGAGKTTQVPLALRNESWLGDGKIILLEPRRIAARAAAQFMAAQLGEEVGNAVGYRIRFESRVSANTCIEVITEGILTRMIQSDPELPGVGAIIFDEFHERHLHGDLGAALALDVQASLRPDLRLLIMSATLDGERVQRWFDAERITSAGRSFPVRIEYPPARAQEDWTIHLRRVADAALAETDGDILVFLPGRREIERATRCLAALAENSAQPIQLVPLHGDLPLAQQHAALSAAESGSRRIVLATNVAESSVTLPGICAVIDSGRAREPRFDPNSGFTRLQTVGISQASADQRAGRAGRVKPGTAWRLWPQSRRLQASRHPEIAQVELSALALDLAAWGSADLHWLDAPPAGALAGAHDLLRLLGALDPAGWLSTFGRAMLDTGATPRLAAMFLRAPQSQRALACDVLALIESRNPLRGTSARSDDFRERHSALAAFRQQRARAREFGADPATLFGIDQASSGWRRRNRTGAPDNSIPGALDIGNLLVHAFPDRIARQDSNDPHRYRLGNGRGAHLHADSSLFGEPWLVVVDLRFDERDSLILSAAPFDETILERDFAGLFLQQRSTRWNREARALEAFEERRFAALVLERRRVAVREADAMPALLEAIRELGLDALSWSDHARALRTRVRCLRDWCPDLALPDLDEAALLVDLERWLGPYLAGKTRLDALTPQMLGEALAARLDYTQRRQVDTLAPESLRVPSGHSHRLQYEVGKPPVLAVKLQEMFGLADTPHIADGRIAVVLHLLSPARRPIQVTQDLRGFWERTYPQVKKELKGRYPKHYWPEDPWNATATARVRPRS